MRQTLRTLCWYSTIFGKCVHVYLSVCVSVFVPILVIFTKNIRRNIYTNTTPLRKIELFGNTKKYVTTKVLYKKKHRREIVDFKVQMWIISRKWWWTHWHTLKKKNKRYIQQWQITSTTTICYSIKKTNTQKIYAGSKNHIHGKNAEKYHMLYNSLQYITVFLIHI